MINYSVSYKTMSLKNYKNLSDAALELNGLRILVGSNNSGKSNFLNFPKQLHKFLYGGVSGKSAFSGDATFKKKAPVEFELRFNVLKGKAEAEYACTYRIVIQSAHFSVNLDSAGEKKFEKTKTEILSESLVYKETGLTGPVKEFFSRDKTNVKVHKDIAATPTEINPISSVLELLSTLDIKLEELHTFILKKIESFLNTSVFTAHNINKKFDEDFLKKISDFQDKEPEKFNLFKQTFCEALGFKNFIIDRLQISPDKLMMNSDDSHGSVEKEYIYRCFVDTGKDVFPASRISDGSKILLFMLFKIHTSSEKLIIIDEPEIGLHPYALNALFESLRRSTSEISVLIATHSTYLLNIVDHNKVSLSENIEGSDKYKFISVSDINNLAKRLKSKYVNFGDLLVENFRDSFTEELD